MEPSQNGNDTASSPLQRIAIGAGALIVIVLTVIAAVFLAMQDLPQDETTPTVVAQTSPTGTIGATPIASPSTSTPTQISSSPSPTNTNTPTPIPADTDTPTPPTATDQPTETPSPTETNTPVPPPPTNTPTPAEVTNCGTPPPSGWVAYTVQTGDTFNSLATRTNTSVFDLQETNCLRTIQNGDVIYLPFAPPTPTPTGTPTVAGTRRPTATRTGTPIAPKISNVIARQTGEKIIVIVEGQNFRSQERGFRAELVGPNIIELTLGPARTSTNFEASAPVDQIQTGTYDLVVVNPNGQLGTQEKVFPPSNATPTATPLPPRIDDVDPDRGRVSEEVRVTIKGRNFGPFTSGFEIEMIPRSSGSSRFYTPNQDNRPAEDTIFDIVIPAGDLNSGFYDIKVTNPDNQSSTKSSAYEAQP